MNKNTMLMRIIIALALAIVLLAAVPVFAQEDEELAKKSQNPIANLISLPLQNNTSFGVGPADAVINDFNIQPVYPISAGKVNVINRFILPITYQGELVQGIGSKTGLGDLSYTAFISPANTGSVTWGIGPSFLIPTATDERLGTGKWSAGVGVIVLTTTGKWVVGFLVQNTWSFAGDKDRADVNFFFSQYFINYNFEGFYLSSAPIITANWEANSDNRWTIPLGGGLGKVFRIGKQPINAQVSGYYNVEKPQFGADWTLRVQLQFLFPK